MKGIFPIDKFRTLQTPFYYYDTKVLRDTLSAINHEVAKYPNYSVHYAVKANANPKVLAIIRDSRIIRYYTEKRPAPQDLKSYASLNDRVFVLKLTPEVKAEIFDLLSGHYDAIILETFGIGGIPEYDDSFEKAIFSWVDSGKTIAVTTQVPEEGCDLGVYQVGKKFSNHKGILQSDDMTTESIVAKLMWILGQTDKQDEIARLFYREINHDRV